MSKQENLEELVSTAERFSLNNSDSENIIQDFLDNASLEAGEYQSKINEDPIQLMTIHMSKGLEFPVVFLTGLEEGVFPNENRNCLLYTSPSPRDRQKSRMPSSA